MRRVIGNWLLRGLFISGFIAIINAQEKKEPPPIGKGPIIQFEKEVHDFGNIKQGDPAEYEFVFKNIGDEPLVITNARSSCGCTVPHWTNEPVPPNGRGVIKVKYDSQRVGPINKTITVTSNAVNQPTVNLRITGNVEAVQQGALAPAQPKPPVPTNQ